METHIVRQGECLSSIAHHYGFPDWRAIYDHPSNAEFKAKRPNPNLIYPGDELYIPDFDLREVDCQTEKRHRFMVISSPTYINVCVQDPAQQPIAGAPYSLLIESLEFEGSTDDAGWIKRRIPAWAELGWLTVWPNPSNLDEAIKWEIKLGHLDPLETITGVKGRLNNLGYDLGEVNDVEDEQYEAAVRRFQEDQGLLVDGIVGPQTRDRLQQKHRI